MRIEFNPDSKIWKFFDYVGDLIILNLLFLLTSMPIFTIGASITAMDAVLFRKKEKKCDSVREDYFHAWKENFKNSTIIWLIFLAFLLMCGLNLLAVINANPSNKAVILILLGAILAVLFMTVLYSFAMLARFDNDWLTTICKSLVIAVLSLPYTIVVFLILAAAVLLTVQSSAALLVAAGIWILIGFSLVGFLSCSMFYRAFRKFTFEEDLPKDTVDSEMYQRREYYREEKKRRNEKNKASKHLKKGQKA